MDLSLVIPIHNEQENLSPLLKEIHQALGKLDIQWEILAVDDGSTDQSLKVLRSLQPTYPNLRILTFDKNYGQSSAFSAGFEHAKGRYILTLDGDGQNDPADIPNLYQRAHEADLIVGWRKNRQDTLSKKLTSRAANAVRSRFCQDHIHDTGCSLKLMRAEALKKIKIYKGLHRFLPALFKIEGFSVIEVPVNHRPRNKGSTKYHFLNRSIGPFLDMLAVRWMINRQLKHQIKAQYVKGSAE